MAKLWHIDSSVLGDNSVSRKLSAGIVAQFTAADPSLEVSYLDLAAQPLGHMSPAHIGAMFGHPPADEATQADIARGQAALDELFAADVIVIGAPMYNFGLPSQLKSLIDRLLAAGKTFKYGENGQPQGLVDPAKRVFIASSRGGVYSGESAFAPFDHQETHLVGALNFIGLTDISVIRAEGVNVPALKEGAIASAQAEIAKL
ncbi:FMN-dependent NADH-azoreductase [Acidocella sp.]|uniref:FMN-dependent NADH-azoreductase n=1 Tax=Acidocella sp. TaxID=50710 RepID=UPI002625030D|nr:NAD(P)H-dependent oxidoreductase [Acidocella sp.]